MGDPNKEPQLPATDPENTKEEDKNIDRDGRERQPTEHTDRK